MLPVPNISLPQQYFILSNPALSHLHEDARKQLLEGIQADSESSRIYPTPDLSLYVLLCAAEMAPYYRLVTSKNVLTLDQALLDSMEAENTAEIAKLDERLAEAEKTEGESDIADALRARASYLTQIGDKVCALSACCLSLGDC